MKSNVVWIIAGVVGLLVLVQFFRYDYIHTTGQVIVRVDRLTGTSCLVPCQPVESTPLKPLIRTAITIGPGARPFGEKAGCRSEVFAGDSFGVINVMSNGPLPKSGDELVGNFDDLGGMKVQDATTHTTLDVDIPLRTSRSDVAMGYMRDAGCLKPGNWAAYALNSWHWAQRIL
jgi:hypothetical protein